MSWGVATQNGVSVSLASIVSLSCGATEFSPASLFTSGVAGAWYDPSDTSTLFQDSAGTTPVTAVEQPVGLMLDKSQGLVLGSELVPDYDFATPASWTPETADWVVSGGKATYTKPGAGVQYLQSNDNISIVSGTWYKVTYTISGIAASNNAIFGLFNKTASTNYLGGYQTITANGTYSIYFLATSSTTGIRIYGNAGSTSASWSFESFGIKSLAGNHASQATAASRPVLRARYNLLTYSEQFDNAAWTKINMAAFGSGSIVNATTAPDGTTTADKIVASNTASATRGVYQNFTPTSGATYTIIFYAKAAEYSKFGVCEIGGARFGATFDLSAETTTSLGGSGFISSSITSVGFGWYRCVIVSSAIATGWAITAVGYPTGASLSAAGISYAGDGTSGIYIWGADLRTGSSAGTYQRIAAATDYATAGFLPYLALSTDDSFTTNSIDCTATDKMSVCVGVTKNSDTTGFGMICELGNTSTANPGSFGLFAPATGGTPSYHVGLARSAASLADLTTYAAPITNVIFVGLDFAGASRATAIIPRVNGSTPTISGGANVAPGTGNFGNYPLYIGRRAGSSLPLEGRIYQMVVCGKTLSASELASTEAYVNSKTGAY